MPNFAGVKCGYVVATPENIALKESGYDARKENELAVLVEFIDSSKIESPEATFLDIILYSREQIIKENEAMGSAVSKAIFATHIIRCLLIVIDVFITATRN